MACFFMAIILWCALKEKIDPGAIERVMTSSPLSSTK
jgi:hypothetical protein